MRLTKLTIGCMMMVLIVACKKETPAPSFPDGQIPIGFGAQSGEAMKSGRAIADTTNAAFEKDKKFVVYSNYDYNLVNGQYTQTVAEFQKQLVYYDEQSTATNKWTYSPKKYWSGTGAYRFRACFPDTADIVSSSSGRNLAINYSIYKDRYDLMVAHHYRDMGKISNEEKTKPVDLIFNHTLAAVRMKLVTETGKRYHMDYMSVINLYTVAVFSYNCETDSKTVTPEELYQCWIPSYMDHSDAIYGYTGDDLSKDWITDDTTEKTYICPYLYAIPQKIDPTQPDCTKVLFTIDVNGQKVTTVKDIPAITWLPGKKYTYVINVKPGTTTTIDVITTDWDAVDATSDDVVIDQ